MANIINFPAKDESLGFVKIVTNEDEFSIYINNTSIKVSYFNEDDESLVLLSYGDYPPAVIPRDVFQEWVSAIDFVGDINNDCQYEIDDNTPIAAWHDEEGDYD